MKRVLVNRWFLAVAALSAIAVVSGCDRSGLPKTHPVKGKVVFKRDGSPVKGGTIEMKTTSDPTLQAISDIRPDGTFTLVAYKDGREKPGAVEGEYQVFVELDQQDEERRLVRVAVPGTITLKPGGGDVTIEIDRPRPRR